MIKETTNYQMFKKHAHNRDLAESNVQKIMKSIQIKNLLEFRPILVDQNFHVIDGQHRLEAAQRLNIPIFYEVKKSPDVQEIILLNDNSKGWRRADYLNFYCQSGNANYMKLKQFVEKHEVSIDAALILMGKAGTHDNAAGFKNGNFKFPTEMETGLVEVLISQTREFIEYASQKIARPNNYLRSSRFIRAAYLFLSIKAVDFNIFMEKVTHRIDLLHPCARTLDFVRIFKTIYNWRNRNPVTLEEDVIAMS